MRKMRIMSLLLAVLMLASALPLTAFAASKTMYVKTDNGLSLNVRSSMKTKSDNVITRLSNGTKVTVLSEYGSWAKITWGSKSSNKGYVVKKYLSSTKPRTTTSCYRYVKTDNKKALNMRSSMNTRRENVIASIPNGTRVYVYDFYTGGWAKVKYNGKIGYVLSKYLFTKK